MDSSLQQMALIAAMCNRQLRGTLDVEEFSGKLRVVAAAIKASQGVETRKTVQDYLAGLGVAWDGEVAIGEAILLQLKQHNDRQRAQRLVNDLQRRLRYPNMAGQVAVDEALKILKIYDSQKEKP